MPELHDIKQITKHDLTGDNISKTVTIGDTGVTVEINYKQFIPTSPVFKFGFCMNTNSGIICPIYLKREGSETYDEFVLGKTGMYEWQPEDWTDVNDDNEPRTAECNIVGFELPFSIPDSKYKIDFVLDYCC